MLVENKQVNVWDICHKLAKAIGIHAEIWVGIPTQANRSLADRTGTRVY